MRVVEPANFRGLRQKRTASRIKLAWLFFIAVVGLGGWWFWATDNQSKASNSTHKSNAAIEIKKVKGDKTAKPLAWPKPLKNFTPGQFKQLYLSISYANVLPFRSPVPITGNSAADYRIRSLAEALGYRQTSLAVQPIVQIPGLYEDDNLLQLLAFNGWLELKAAADRENIPLTIVSAYRSPEYQRNLFLSRLLSNSVTADTIAAGESDAAIQKTLHLTAVPGYSRHHTGYTIDLWCHDGSSTFASSKCFNWLNANNYKNAKEHGWIPSYPAGAGEQGPEPEAWEYVWVGRDRLT